MIFSLEIPISELEKLESELLETRISALLRAHRLGSHLVIFGREQAKWLSQNINLIRSDQSTLARLQQQVTQTGNLLSQADCYVSVVEPGATFCRLDNKNLIQIQVDYVDFESILSSPLFIIEDIVTDLPIYKFVFANVRRAHPISFDPFHGGGSRLWDTMKLKGGEPRLVYVVGDSDRKSPLSSKSKAIKAQSMADSISSPLLFFALTPGSEIENLFGLDVIGQLSRVTIEPTYGVLLKIAEAENISHHPIHEAFEWHFDMKSGLSTRVLESLTDPPEIAWIESKLQLAAISKSAFSLPAFGGKLCSEILASNECMAEFRNVVRSARWQKMYGAFIFHIMWVFAASTEQRT